ncbi:MAG: leucine-rich repeat domain-containing protein [Silvanigrellaceae bacterium]|nr:leucine-rich repeat domain-containing protein [Silvanigrellaceae bacterium]
MIKKSYLLIYTVTLTLFFGCGIDPKNDTNTQDITVLKTPNLNMSASIPQDPIYSSPKQTISNKNIAASVNSNSDIVYNEGGVLFTATKNGGLGADFDSENKLVPYAGIPIKIEKKELTGEPTINISALGVVGSANDEACPNIFSYNKAESVISINTKNITALTICKVTINASSAEDNKVYTATTSFEIVLNLTFSGYYKLNDKGALYIKKYSGIQSSDVEDSILRVSQYLKDKSNQDLNLNYDPNLISRDEKFTNFDAITAVQTITSLYLVNTNLNNLNAIINLPNLVSLDISGTKVDPKDLRLLSKLSNLKKLSVRDMDIKDISIITKYLPNLEELDISENVKIENLDNIKNLKNLRILKAKSIGLKTLKQLENLTQISGLDISGNDFSKIKNEEANILINLYKLNSLDISNSGFPDEVLNNYFGSLSASRLVTFIDRNTFNRNSVGQCKYNNFARIDNIKNIVNLELLDLSGNSCQSSIGSFQGITTSDIFKYMKSLKTLNIANTALSNLDALRNLNIQNLILNEPSNKGIYSPENAIMVTKNRCKEVLGQSQKACNYLSDGSEKSIEFKTPGSQNWTVPANVTTVKIIGCSGANGGAGGGGGGAAGALFSGSWSGSSWGGNGGAGGPVNDSGYIGGGSGSAGQVDCGDSVCRTNADHFDSWQHGQNGGAGGSGGITSFGNQNFSAASQFNSRDTLSACIGGVSGSGGSGGTNQHANPAVFGGPGGNGGTPAYPYGWSSKIETYTVQVTPGQTIQINVGTGGSGGGGGAGGTKQNGGYYRGSHVGSAGSGGSSGSDGFIKIYYESL